MRNFPGDDAPDLPVPGPAATTVDIETEAYQMLLARAQRRTGRVPPELIARHVLSVTRGADWPVQRDALEALLRRFAFGRADRLQIVARPAKGRRLGLYATRRVGSPARPYRTLLRRCTPTEGSCDCADFLRSSLGLCKHLLTVLEDVASRRGGLDEAGREPIPPASPLCWDPVRPLTGPGDWLARIIWTDGLPVRDLRRWFHAEDGGGWTLEAPAPSSSRGWRSSFRRWRRRPRLPSRRPRGPRPTGLTARPARARADRGGLGWTSLAPSPSRP